MSHWSGAGEAAEITECGLKLHYQQSELVKVDMISPYTTCQTTLGLYRVSLGSHRLRQIKTNWRHPLWFPITVWFLSHQGTSDIFVSWWTHFLPFPVWPHCSIWVPDHSCLPQVIFSLFFSHLYPFPLPPTYLTVTFSPLFDINMGVSWVSAHFPSLDSPKEILSIAGASITKWMADWLPDPYF